MADEAWAPIPNWVHWVLFNPIQHRMPSFGIFVLEGRVFCL